MSQRYNAFPQRSFHFCCVLRALAEARSRSDRLGDHTGHMAAAIVSRGDASSVLVAGDTHENTAWVEGLIRTAAEQNCPIVIQVGDV